MTCLGLLTLTLGSLETGAADNALLGDPFFRLTGVVAGLLLTGDVLRIGISPGGDLEVPPTISWICFCFCCCLRIIGEVFEFGRVVSAMVSRTAWASGSSAAAAAVPGEAMDTTRMGGLPPLMPVLLICFII